MINLHEHCMSAINLLQKVSAYSCCSHLYASKPKTPHEEQFPQSRLETTTVQATDLAERRVRAMPFAITATHTWKVSVTWYDIKQDIQAQKVLYVCAIQVFELHQCCGLCGGLLCTSEQRPYLGIPTCQHCHGYTRCEIARTGV